MEEVSDLRREVLGRIQSPRADGCTDPPGCRSGIGGDIGLFLCAQRPRQSMSSWSGCSVAGIQASRTQPSPQLCLSGLPVKAPPSSLSAALTWKTHGLGYVVMIEQHIIIKDAHEKLNHFM